MAQACFELELLADGFIIIDEISTCINYMEKAFSILRTNFNPFPLLNLGINFIDPEQVLSTDDCRIDLNLKQ